MVTHKELKALLESVIKKCASQYGEKHDLSRERMPEKEKTEKHVLTGMFRKPSCLHPLTNAAAPLPALTMISGCSNSIS